MPVFKVQAPDGKIIKVEAADEATAIRGAQEHYASLPKAKPNVLKDVGNSLVSGLREGAAGLTDTFMQATPFGQVEQGLKSAANMAGVLRGRAPEINAPFSANSDQARSRAYTPQTTAGEYARTLGQNAPNALAPGSLAARAVNVFAPAIASETAGQIARASGAGRRGETAARIGGSVVGAGVASLRPQNLFAPRTEPMGMVGTRAKQDPSAMRQKAQDFRDSGIEPTLVDVVDDAGRGMVKAAANRPTPGRQVANQFARGRALDLPSRIDTQAARSLSKDARTPDAIREAITKRRSATANQAFGAVRNETLEMAPETVQALRTDYGRNAIREAVKRERDPEVRAALNRLANDALDNPSTPITVGMADRISRVLNGQSQAAGRNGDRELAGVLRSLGEGIRDPARQASPGYRKALEGFAADSRLNNAADIGETFLQRNTDQFSKAATGMAPAERTVALATARRAIGRAAGENVSAAPGVARKLAEAPEQQARNRALMGPERANIFQRGVGMEAEAVDNAAMIAPKRGSPTFLNADDGGTMSGALQVGRRVVKRDVLGLLADGADWLRTRGLNNDQAEAVVRMAVDPARTDEAIQIIAKSLGEQQARHFVEWRNAALLGAAGGTMGFRSAPEEQQGR